MIGTENIGPASPSRIRQSLVPSLVLLLTVLIDQVSKGLVSGMFHEGESIPIGGSLVKLTYIHNPRGAFGLPLGGNIVFVIVSLLAMIFIAYLLWSLPAACAWSRLALSLILGGAMGNLIDRFRCGEVVDFIDIGVGQTRWPIFNVADIGVTVGAVLLCYAMFLKKESWHGETLKEGCSGTREKEAT